MIKPSFINGMLITAVAAVIALPVFLVFIFTPAIQKRIAQDTIKQAESLANHLRNMIITGDEPLDKTRIPPGFLDEVRIVANDFNLPKVKVFSSNAKVIFSTDPQDIGKVHTGADFEGVLKKGLTYSEIVKKETTTLEGEISTADVVETYVPIIKNGSVVGVFEIYSDITESNRRFSALLVRFYTFMSIIAVFFLLAVLYTTKKAKTSVRDLNNAQDRIIKQSNELMSRNEKLTALYEVASAIGRKIDLKELLAIALDTVTGLEIFKLEQRGGIFIVEGERLKLLVHKGAGEVFLKMHENTMIGDCLCGLAAQTGEIIVSANSEKDHRHTYTYPGIVPHGHIILPLKTAKGVVGVLYLYMPADAKLDEGYISLLASIGNQIGIAIENASLYEETRSLALHDPLTGLANRRHMEIVFNNKFAMAKRYNTDLSVIMADIDHFKNYNDTYGHNAGDMLLVNVAKTIQKESRVADLVVRYGGEEILILLSETTALQAAESAERLRLLVDNENGITMSFGVASLDAQMHTKEDLVKKADTALYNAKQGGRNQVVTS